MRKNWTDRMTIGALLKNIEVKPVADYDFQAYFQEKLETLRKYPQKDLEEALKSQATDPEFWTWFQMVSQRIDETIRHRAHRNSILRPPGSVLGRIAEFFLSKKTLEQIVNPIIADMQAEHFEALSAGRRCKAGWVCVRGYWSFFKAIGLYTLVKAAFDVWRKISAG